MTRQFYVYIMTNPRHTALYTGMTNNLIRRVWQHKNTQDAGFTGRYHCSVPVLYEVYLDAYNAIAREKQIKSRSRTYKIELSSERIRSGRTCTIRCSYWIATRATPAHDDYCSPAPSRSSASPSRRISSP
jgi:putative endonuclease